jgi:YHS domain-containing protein
MKRMLIGILVGAMAIIFGVYPVRAQQERPPSMEQQVEPTSLIGIPPVLTAVQYRRCPIDGQRLKMGKSAVFEGKAYRFCCNNCLESFWENPQRVVLKVKNCREAPLTIMNKDGKCVCCEQPASRQFCRLYRETITFFCSSACREKETKGHRTTVSRKVNPDGTSK